MKDEKLQQKANFMNKVTFSSTNKQLNLDYAKEIKEALKNYTLPSSNFKVDDLGDCREPPASAICVYLKLNRVWGWEPKPIDTEDIKKAGKIWPEDFVRHWQTQDNTNFVWISCKPKNDEDREKFEDFEYFPSNRGIDMKYFPFVKTKEVQLPPLVAVKITPTSSFEDETSVEIQCLAFYKGKIVLLTFFSSLFPHNITSRCCP